MQRAGRGRKAVLSNGGRRVTHDSTAGHTGRPDRRREALHTFAAAKHVKGVSKRTSPNKASGGRLVASERLGKGIIPNAPRVDPGASEASSEENQRETRT